MNITQDNQTVEAEQIKKYYSYTQKYVTKSGEIRECRRTQKYIPTNGKRGPKPKNKPQTEDN